MCIRLGSECEAGENDDERVQRRAKAGYTEHRDGDGHVQSEKTDGEPPPAVRVTGAPDADQCEACEEYAEAGAPDGRGSAQCRAGFESIELPQAL